MSRPRLIETGKFHRCRDRDLSRLRNITVVETETDRDWAKDVETETLSRVSLISASAIQKLEFDTEAAKIVLSVISFPVILSAATY